VKFLVWLDGFLIARFMWIVGLIYFMVIPLLILDDDLLFFIDGEDCALISVLA